jgi:prolyl-tRNA editing enzyme YbaK/EbsC (Cys-tRNA(Pro) deacylase)
MAPSFLLKTDTGYMMAIIRGDTRISYRAIKRELGLKNVSLADSDTFLEVTGVAIGAVSLVNPDIPTLIDRLLLGLDQVYGGSGIERYTLQIRVEDLVRVTGARVFEFASVKPQS